MNINNLKDLVLYQSVELFNVKNKMIIWINGSFGVGKTTIAEKLKEKIRNSILYDP